MKKIFLPALFIILFSKQALSQNGGYKIEYKKSKAGLVHSEYNKKGDNKWVLPADYDSIITVGAAKKGDVTLFSYLIYNKGKCGVFTNGKYKASITIPCQYSSIKFMEGYFMIQENGKWGLYNEFEEKWELDISYDEIETTRDDFQYLYLFFVTKNAKKGLFQAGAAKWVFDPTYDELLRKNEIIFLTKGNKMGAYSYSAQWTGFRAEVEFIGKWLIPLLLYDKISLVAGSGEFMVTDSAGKKGVWQYLKTEAWVVAPASFSTINYVSNEKLLYLESADQKSILSKNGWIKRPGSSEPQLTKTITLIKTEMRLDYVMGKGFELTSNGIPRTKTISIPDKNSYDSFYLKGNLLVAVNKKRFTVYLVDYENYLGERGNSLSLDEKDRLTPIKAELVFADADQFFSAGGGNIYDWLYTGCLSFQKQGKWTIYYFENYSNTTSVARATLRKSNLALDSLDLTLNPNGMLLASSNGKWGIFQATGEPIVPFIYRSYKVISGKEILLQSIEKDSWSMFLLKEKTFRTFIHNNKPRTDFAERKIDGVNEKLVIDNKEYYIHEGYTTTPDIDWYTSESWSNTGTTGDVVRNISTSLGKYAVRSKSGGLGLYRYTTEIIPPIMKTIEAEIGRDEKFNSYIKLILEDKKDNRVSLDAGYLGKTNLHDFVAIKDKLTCPVCNGKRGENVTTTRTIKGETTYNTTEKTEYKESYEKVWDMQTRSYKMVKKLTPVTRYDAGSKTSPDKKVTNTDFIKCHACEGKGYKENVKMRCKIGPTGLQPGDTL